MIHLRLRHWVNRTPRSSGKGRQRTDGPTRHYSRPMLEVLEERCLPSTVTNLNDAGDGSLRQAIFDTPPGGTVDFQPGLTGTITLTSGELAILKDLTIAGPGPGLVTVSGNHGSRVFSIGITLHVTISGLMIINGQTPSGQNGGGITNSGTLTLTDSIVTGNSASVGGGIQNTGTLTVTNSRVNGNSASGSGGINNDGRLNIAGSTLNSNNAAGGGAVGNSNSGTAVITDSTLGYNQGGGSGGGIRNNGGTATIIRSIIIGNSTPGGNAGGIFTDGVMSLTDSTISGNSSEGGGGGILSGGQVAVTRCTFSNNSAGSGGGGIANFGMLTVTDSTFSANSALFGGGIAAYTGSATVTLSTLSGNHAGLGGGGVDAAITPLAARNTIIAGNTGGQSPEIRGTLNSQGHNLIGDGTGASGFVATDLVGMSSNPIDPELGPLQDNGGPTQTMALLPDSPALADGDTTDAPEWDQRGPGYARIVDGMIDIGAFELQPTPNVTCSVAQDMLWPPSDELVNVGLSVEIHPADATLHHLVYGNDHANSGDVSDIAPDTLQLRASRDESGTGRVYLIVAQATNAGGTSSAFDVCTVVVPRSNTDDDIASAQLQALGSATWYWQHQTAPPRFSLLGEGPGSAPGPGSRNGVVAAVRLGQVVWKSPESPALLVATIAASDRSTVAMWLAAQPVSPILAETTPAPLLHWEGQQTQGTIFEEWGPFSYDPFSNEVMWHWK